MKSINLLTSLSFYIKTDRLYILALIKYDKIPVDQSKINITLIKLNYTAIFGFSMYVLIEAFYWFQFGLHRCKNINNLSVISLKFYKF